MLAVSVLFVELEIVLVELFLDALKGLLVVGVGVGKRNALWLVDVVAFVPDTPLGVEEDVPNPENPVPLCEGLLSVDGTAVLKIELVLVKDEGCAAVPKIELVCVAFETPLLEDVTFGLNRHSEKIPIVDGDLVVLNILLLGGRWVDALLLEGAEFGPNKVPPRDSIFFRESRDDDPKVQSLLLETLLVAEESRSAKFGTPDSCLASLVSVSPLFAAIV